MTLAYILIVALAVFCFYLFTRIAELEERIESALAELKQLRRGASVAREGSVEPAPVVIAPVIPAAPIQEEVQIPLRKLPPPLPPEPVFAAPAKAHEGPTLSERLRKLLGDEEWETIVGGSLLNKAGALILVIGIALFLGFSFGRITPAGRAGTAFAISAGILCGGVWLERRQRYQVFARGLIGAGWAALYATTYAVYAVPAARVIEDPFVGSLGVLVVAAGMIGHSLRYKAEAVTGIAYFAAFAALAATPSSPFAVVSLIPLAASLLFLAARFDWYSMALFGLAATWLTCISRGSSGAPLMDTQSLFLFYWLLFEAFDLLRTQRGVRAGGVEWIYPGNVAGFVGLSYVTWSTHSPADLWLAATVGSALFLADSIARAFLRRPGDDFIESFRFGGYESSAFVSALLGGLAIVGRVEGLWMSAGLAVEAEVIYLAGVRWNSRFLRRMGISAFAHSLVRLFWEQPAGKSDVLGHATWNQTPPAILHAIFFWLNRYLRRPNVLMSSAAAILMAGVLTMEVPEAWISLAWVLFGLILLEVALRGKQRDFLLQSYVLLAGGAASAFWSSTASPAIGLDLLGLYGCALRSRWIEIPGWGEEKREIAWGASAASVALAGLFVWRVVPVAYVGLAWAVMALLILELGTLGLPAELRIFFAPAGLLAVFGVGHTHFDDFVKFPAPAVWISYFGTAAIALLAAYRNREEPEVRDGAFGIGIMEALAGLWLVVPDPWVSPAWTALGIAVLELGVAVQLESIRRISLVPLALVYCRTFAYDLDRAPLRAAPFGIAGFYWAWHRFREGMLARVLFWLAVVPLLLLILVEAHASKTPLGWMLVSFVLLFAGTRFGIPGAELQSGLIAIAAFGLALVAGSPWWISLGTAAGFYGAQFLSKKSAETRAPIAFSIGGTLLVASVLYDQISGSLLTVSLGLEGLALLGVGFGLRERLFRLQGLALLLFCILKLFVYDLRNLETMYRILSFVALGLILLGVSWIYTRFREHVKKLL
jgi:uncharacterized membrane protein